MQADTGALQLREDGVSFGLVVHEELQEIVHVLGLIQKAL
jgi:hypothetical protein